MISNKRIEMLSINFLTHAFLNSERIDPQISDNDKEPSWDGNIFLYKDNEFKKDDIAKIPVQVKGHHQKEEFDGSTMKYDLKKSDLINYKNHNGVLFIIVQIKSKDNCKVFYNDLLSSDINEILTEMGKHKQKTVEFKHYDMRNAHSIETVLLNFHRDRIKHSPSDVYINEPYKFDKIVMEFEAFDDNFKETLFKSRPIYGMLKSFPEKSFPITRAEVASISIPIKKTISVDGIEYYNEVIRIETNNIITAEIGESTKIITYKNDSEKTATFKLQINLSGKFYERYKDSKFIEALFKKNKFEIDGFENTLPVDLSITDDMKHQIDSLENINLLYQALQINKNLDIDAMSDEDTRILHHLIDYFVNGNKKAFTVNNDGLLKIKISNLTLKFFAQKINDSETEIINIFSPNLYIKSNFEYADGIIEEYSYLLTFKREDFIELSNLHIERIYNSVISEEVPYSERYLISLNAFLLEMIHAFDLSGSRELYVYALKLNNFLFINSETPIIALINKFQLILRDRALRDDELKEIAILKKKYSQSEGAEDILFALNVLTNNLIDATLYYENLSDKRRKDFNDYPIMMLYKNK